MEDIRYNASGYYDPTAYQAIKNISGGGKTMIYNPGEIWEVDGNSGESMAVIISAFPEEGYASIIKMVPQDKGCKNNIKIRGREELYADAGRLQYTFENNLIRYVRSMGDGEWKEVQDAVRKALGLEYAAGELQEDPRQAEPKEQTRQAEAAPQIANENAVKLAEVTKEAEIYKGLYYDMLELVVGERK